IFNGHSEKMTSVAYSPNGSHIVSGSLDMSVKIWRVPETRSNEEVKVGTCVMTLKGHTDTVNSVAYSPDGQHIASSGSDRSVKIWRVSDGACVATLNGHTNSVWEVAYSPDGEYLVSGSFDKSVKIWRVSETRSDENMDPEAKNSDMAKIGSC